MNKPYLCGPIHNAEDRQLWRQVAKQFYPDAIDPCRRVPSDLHCDGALIRMDKRDILASDFVLIMTFVVLVCRVNGDPIPGWHP